MATNYIYREFALGLQGRLLLCNEVNSTRVFDTNGLYASVSLRSHLEYLCDTFQIVTAPKYAGAQVRIRWPQKPLRGHVLPIEVAAVGRRQATKSFQFRSILIRQNMLNSACSQLYVWY